MTGLEKAVWIGGGIFSASTAVSGIAWRVNASRERACDARVRAEGSWIPFPYCIGEALSTQFSKRLFIISSVLTVAALTTAGVVRYRWKR